MIKLIAIDLDGTVFYNRGKFNQADIEAFHRAHNAGIKISICTGRATMPTREVAKILGIYDFHDIEYVVENGGKVVYFDQNDKVHTLMDLNFKLTETYDIFALAKKYKVKLFAYSGDDFAVVNSKTGFFYWYMKKHSKRTTNRFDKTNSLLISKKIAFGKSKRIIKLRNHLTELGFNTFSFSYFNGKQNNIEIMPSGVNKIEGLKFICQKNDINQNEVMYFGDGENDKECLKWVGTGVVMKNASDHVKKVAKFETESVKNAGVAKFINDYLNKA